MASGLLGEGPSNGSVDVAAFMDSDLPGRVARVVSLGVLVSIGTTRDRGALSLTVTQDGDWDREYFRRVEDALDWLDHAFRVLAARVDGAPAAQAVPTQRPLRRRQKLS